VKRTVTLAIAGALTLGTAAPSLAATATSTVNVKWNVTAIGTIKTFANYGGTATVPTSTNSAGTINSALGATADTTSRCTGGAAPGTTAPYLVDFGNVQPDLANPTACIYNNAVAVQIQTNSTSWSVSESISAVTNGFIVCAVPNNAAAWPIATASLTSGTTTIPTSTKVAGTALVTTGTSACPAGDSLAAPVTLVSTGSNGTGYTALGEDLGLIIPASATGAGTPQTPTITFTLTYT
jgi:hypothetical protein